MTDSFMRWDIQEDVREIEELLATGIFDYSARNDRNPFRKAAFVAMLIALRDLMAKADKYTTRIAFTDDVISMPKMPGYPKGVNDVTDLIKWVRDAMCHPDSDNNLVVPHIKVSFNVMYGRCPQLISDSNGDFHGPTSDYDDDVAFIFGPQRIYLHRHILRALQEAKQKLLPLTKLQ